MNREFRISHDALYNVYQLCFQLKFSDRTGKSVDFVTHFTMHPRILVHLQAHPLLASLDQILKVGSVTTLHYNTLFNVGDYYLSTLSFRHGLFVREPFVPIAFFIHSRRYHGDHLDFIHLISNSLPSLLTKQVNIVTDREFQLNGVLPLANHLFCWNHLETDLRWYLKKVCNATPEDINFFVNKWKDLIDNETEVDFDRDWDDMSNSDRFVARPKVLKYFADNIIPVFKAHAAIWVLKDAGVCNAERGITNNPSESMNECRKRDN